jgi:hypothetical protein
MSVLGLNLPERIAEAQALGEAYITTLTSFGIRSLVVWVAPILLILRIGHTECSIDGCSISPVVLFFIKCGRLV